jgi:predicted ABC-type ATPase
MTGLVNPPNRPRVLIIAGPNGAGKTTFAREYLPNEAAIQTFINADLIAAGLSPFNPAGEGIRAGRIMLEMIRSYVVARTDFSFETTLSGKNYARMIPQWRREGYLGKLVFVQLPSPEMAISRVTARVAAGGHHVDDDVVRRRFFAGLADFTAIYQPIVSEWRHYDNSIVPRRLLGWRRNEH